MTMINDYNEQTILDDMIMGTHWKFQETIKPVNHSVDYLCRVTSLKKDAIDSTNWIQSSATESTPGSYMLFQFTLSNQYQIM